MGCNCKAQNNFNKIASKYGEILPENAHGKIDFMNPIKTLIGWIMKIIVGIMICMLFIIISIPIILYVGLFMIVGKEAHINLTKFKIFKNAKQKLQN